MRSPTTLWRRRYVKQMLQPCERSLYNIMATNYNGSLEAVDCHIHSVRYDMAVNRGTCGVSLTTSGHLRHCGDVNTSNKCLSRVKEASILSWPTIMGHQKLLIVIFTA
eukprot:scaffold17077_cov174-Skeletonema_marinoi.AAC.4